MVIGIEDKLKEIAEIERHFHTRSRWLGKKAAQTATDWGDDDETPTIVTKQQTVPWDVGAYVS